MKILKIKHETKTGKSGKQFESCQILTTNSQGQETWISGFGSEITRTWKSGDEINVDVKQNDRGYWNFEPNNNTRPSESEELKLLREINRKLEALNGSKTTLKPESGTTYQFDTESYAQGQIDGNAIDMNVVAEDLPW